jgi:CRP-like cAMP-binding protein
MHASFDVDLPVSAFLQRIEQYDALAADERKALLGIIGAPEKVRAGTSIVREGDRPGRSTLLLDGMMYRARNLSDGGRQIVALHIPGDFVDLHSFLLKTMDHDVVALSPSIVARVSHDDLRRVTARYPHLTRLLWLLTLVDGAILREWAAGLGRRTALERTAHLFCELHLRMNAAGRDGDQRFELPVTQTDLADVLGISAVHTNRTLQELRERQLLTFNGGTLQILDIDALWSLANFDPTYLHQVNEPR